MRIYKIVLDKSSKKFRCPNCGKKRFVKFIEVETGNYLEDQFGRCDRESSCGYIRHPKYARDESFVPIEIPEIIPSFHDFELVERTHKSFSHNNFVQFLYSKYPKDKVDLAIEKYLIGTSRLWKGATIFWQIDDELRVRHGKIMHYNKSTGKRKKGLGGRAYIDSVKNTLGLKDFNLQQCLFGLHLTRGLNSLEDIILIVESEKTAVLSSIFLPQYTWLATGSKSGFKYDYLNPIKEFQIVAFPDKSEYDDWLKKSIELNKRGFNISINERIEKGNFVHGYDLADLLFDILMREEK